MAKWNYTPMTDADYEAAVRAAQKEVGDNIAKAKSREAEAWDAAGRRVEFNPYDGWKQADD